MKHPLFALLIVVTSSSVLAQHRCVENGKITYSDRPCSAGIPPSTIQGNPPKVIGDSGNSAYATPYGEWRGQVQFQSMLNGQPVREAHAVVQSIIAIDPQGKVTGTATEYGCKFSGIAMPGMTPTMLTLDITLSACKYSEFNRRLSGSLSLSTVQRYAQISLSGLSMPLGRPAQSFEIKGALRR